MSPVYSSNLLAECETWKIFIEIMKDEYYTFRNELNKILKNKKLNDQMISKLEELQNEILEKEQFLYAYNKKFNKHIKELNQNKIEKESAINNLHYQLLNDQEKIKQNLLDLKKSFSSFYQIWYHSV